MISNKFILPAFLACFVSITAHADTLTSPNPSVATSTATAADADTIPTPLPMAEAIAQEMLLEIKKQNITDKTNHEVMYNLVRTVILPHVDVEGMARSALGLEGKANWKKATDKERAAFVQAFTDLTIRTYAKGLPSYVKQTFNPIRTADLRKAGLEKPPRIEIKSNIYVKKSDQPISVLYRLIYKAQPAGNDKKSIEQNADKDKKSYTWYLYDFSVEGISMIKSFHDQFQDKISKGLSLTELTKEIETHNEIVNNEK